MPVLPSAEGAAPDWRYWSLLGLLAMALLGAAQHLGMLNQGDFWRAIGKFLIYPEATGGGFGNPQGWLWQFQDSLGKPMARGGSSSVIFWLASLPQRAFAEAFHLLWLGAAAQLTLLVLAERLAARIAGLARWSTAARAALAIAFMLVFFAAHNVAFLNSFYMEFAFILGLPLLVLGLLGPAQPSRVAVLAGAVLCGAAKAQYFYLPLLLLGVLWLGGVRTNVKLTRGLWGGLLLVQLLCLLPLLKSGYQQINYHHATRLGSYLVLAADERAALGLSADIEDCIGVDAWGNRWASAGAVRIDSGGHACGSGESLTLSDVLAPYLAYPQVLVRLWQASADAHFTVQYFHVDANSRYLTPTRGAGYGWGRLLLRLSEWRDLLIGPWLALAILIGGLLAALWTARSGTARLAPALVFLSLFSLSQLLVSLVGEGVRDLSRHWAGAQFGLDLLLLLLIVQMFLCWRPMPEGAAARR